MRGEDHFRIRLIGRCGVDIEAVALDGNSSCLVTDAGELTVEIVSDSSFVAGDGFDVDELASEGDGVHGGENSRRKRTNRLEVRMQNAEAKS